MWQPNAVYQDPSTHSSRNLQHFSHASLDSEMTKVGEVLVMGNTFMLFHNDTFYTTSLIAHIHVIPKRLCNIMCTLVAICVILWSLECTIMRISQTIYYSTHSCSNMLGYNYPRQLMFHKKKACFFSRKYYS